MGWTYLCLYWSTRWFPIYKWNESGFRPPLCTYRLNWARRASWGWRDDWDDTVLQTQDSKFVPWRSEEEHATSRSRRLPTILTFTRRFRSTMGTIDKMFVLNNVSSCFFGNKEKLHCPFLDYFRAFDYVVRDNLWYKVLKLGALVKMLNIIQSIYSTVKSKVRGPTYYITDSFDCTQAFLFSMYVNYLETMD